MLEVEAAEGYLRPQATNNSWITQMLSWEESVRSFNNNSIIDRHKTNTKEIKANSTKVDEISNSLITDQPLIIKMEALSKIKVIMTSKNQRKINLDLKSNLNLLPIHLYQADTCLA